MFVEMFVREGKLARRLHHAAIVRTYEIDKTDNLYYIVMEHLDGIDLSAILRYSRKNPSYRLPVPHCIYIACRVAAGLEYTHRLSDSTNQNMGIVNRDVSPSNIRITFNGTVKILDFGIAKNAKTLNSELGILKGKVSHMSPEQIRGIPVDSRSDLFSLGVVLHEMISNKRLFSGKDEFEVMDRVRRAAVPMPSSFNAKAGRKVDNIVMRLLQKLPEDRYQSASRFYHDAMEILQSYDFSQSELESFIEQIHNAMNKTPSRKQSQSSIVPPKFQSQSPVQQHHSEEISSYHYASERSASKKTVKTALILVACSVALIIFSILIAVKKGLFVE